MGKDYILLILSTKNGGIEEIQRTDILLNEGIFGNKRSIGKSSRYKLKNFQINAPG